MQYFKTTIIVYLCLITSISFAQRNYWQQEIDYQMDIDFDVKTNQFTGSQLLKYTNNSPDTLYKVFYHLYFNAFQPGSMMDVRSRTIADPDGRVMSRISALSKEEIGYQKVKALYQDGEPISSFFIEGTVLEVTLNEPILPKQTTTFKMNFEGQIPLQIRRSGRDNKEGIRLSMSQWYPKIAEYDYKGWHAHPYVGREFYAPWGNFSVNITIDKSYIVAGTGILQNPNEIGYGYEDKATTVNRTGNTLTWKFKAENVHDFVWAADPDYVHTTAQVPNGPLLRFFYQKNENTKEWENLPEIAVKAFTFIQKNFGEYPYSQYSIIQGGDGGMEYPMATLIRGHRSLESLVGVTVHEAMHSWYQGLLGTNESYYAWMDEGFTTYATAETMAHIFKNAKRSQKKNYGAYFILTKSGQEEPLSTHSDHFSTNRAYGLGSYYKGSVALAQMNYLIGKEATARALKKYYYKWRFKHPTPNDFLRVFEKESGLELDWYFDYWINTTHTIDYSIESVAGDDKNTIIALRKVGKMPMPLDVTVMLKDGSKKLYYIPLTIMRGEKAHENKNIPRKLLPDWPWTHPAYTFQIDVPKSQIENVVIDEGGYMADVNPDNSFWTPDKDKKEEE